MRACVCVCVCVCVCSQWHLITERTKAGGGPSGVNEIVTVNRRGSSVRDKELSRGRIQQQLSVVALIIFLKSRTKCCSCFLFFFFLPPRSSLSSFSSRVRLVRRRRTLRFGDVQKKSIRSGVPGEAASSRAGHHDSPALFLPGVCRMKTAF